MKKYSPLAVIIVILLTSCVVSLYPLTEKTGNMVFNKELLGHWKEKDGSAEYIIDTLGGSNRSSCHG